MPKLRLKKHDYNRVVLTDLLPYEVPLQFSNHFFYEFLENAENNKIIKNWIEKVGFTIPLEYTIPKNHDLGRHMGIMHPVSQVSFVDFYQKYDEIILHFCSKSPFTIRSPHKIANTIRWNTSGDREDDESDDGGTPIIEVTDSNRIARSYFAYKDYDFLYKFYDSYKYQRLEKKFNCFRRVDVSRCFYSIYTHSIAWAAAGKQFSKKHLINTNSTFETAFDELMRHVNYNETHGILVGPEISRIFSEVIFQDIDLKIQKRLKECEFQNKKGLYQYRDYDIQRYMDDFFVFTHNKEASELIAKIISEECAVYKLYINEAKNIIQERPFFTKISAVKTDIESIFKHHLNKSAIIEIFSDKKPLRSNQILKEIKATCVKNSVEFSEIDRHLINQINIAHKAVVRIIKSDQTDIDPHHTRETLSRFVGMISYILCMNINFRPIHKVGIILSNIREAIEFRSSKNKTFRQASILSAFEKVIFDEMNLALDSLSTNHSIAERTSLIMILKHLSGRNTLDKKDIIKHLPILVENNNGSDKDLYMRFTTALIYSHKWDKEKKSTLRGYKKYKDDFIKFVQKYLDISAPSFEKTEYFLLFFDFMNCPFIDEDIKWETFENVKKNTNGKSSKFVNEIIHASIPNKASFIAMTNDHRKWPRFTNWNLQTDMHQEVLKKELPLPY